MSRHRHTSATTTSAGSRRRQAPTGTGTAQGAAVQAPTPAATNGGDARERLAALEDLYAQLPALECRGLCGHSCAQHVDASAAERTRLLTAHGVDLDAPTADGACPALTRTWGSPRCRVHADRPMICRLWGIAAAMPCPHGCTPPGGHLDDDATLAALAASLDAGGHPHSGLGDLLHQVMRDPTAAALMARYLRGDRTIASALAEQVKRLSTANARP